jgi:alkylation response protein AidB-like acyl-CoA dehydrogenase
MNFALSDEQELLREAAAGALSRLKTVEAARDAQEGGELPDLWPTACDAGWPGLLIGEQYGGAGLDGLDAMLVHVELGRVLASVGLLGHVTASSVLAAAGDQHSDLLGELASGAKRAAFVTARPPDDLETGWTVDARRGRARVAAPRIDGENVTGEAAWVLDAPDADVLVVVGVDSGGAVSAVLVDAGANGVAIEPVRRYDATRSLAHVSFDGAVSAAIDADEQAIAAAWYLAQALLAAEALGAVEESLKRSVQYSKERFTFGRAIGSYQAVKHGLVEVLRRQENLRSLIYFAGFASDERPEELALAASAARVGAEEALDYGSREFMSVHGGIGATWEHDAPFYFRRAQLSRQLLGGAGDAAARVASELFSAATAGAAKAA